MLTDVFNITSGGNLTLTANTGGELIITTTIASGMARHINVGGGGVLTMETGAKITATNPNNSINFTGVEISSSTGTFNMNGGEISNIGRHGGVYVFNGTFNMSGGIITGCRANNISYGGGVTIQGASAVFNMSGTAIISNNIHSGSRGGGGVHVRGGSTFNMFGGTISGNYISGETSFGGGVYVDATSSFIKTGGTIFGLDEGSPDWNRITQNPGAGEFLSRGHAVYVASTPPKYRNNTADEVTNMNSATAGTGGGWED